jgi:hypothetical protein
MLTNDVRRKEDGENTFGYLPRFQKLKRVGARFPQAGRSRGRIYDVKKDFNVNIAKPN